MQIFVIEMEKIIERIVHARNRKGYTYENMADELGVTAPAYRKIETGETKLTVERLFKISSILETPINELLELENVLYSQNNYSNHNVYQQSIEHFYQENKEMTSELLKAKDYTISLLEAEISRLKKL